VTVPVSSSATQEKWKAYLRTQMKKFVTKTNPVGLVNDLYYELEIQFPAKYATSFIKIHDALAHRFGRKQRGLAWDYFNQLKNPESKYTLNEFSALTDELLKYPLSNSNEAFEAFFQTLLVSHGQPKRDREEKTEGVRKLCKTISSTCSALAQQAQKRAADAVSKADCITSRQVILKSNNQEIEQNAVNADLLSAVYRVSNDSIQAWIVSKLYPALDRLAKLRQVLATQFSELHKQEKIRQVFEFKRERKELARAGAESKWSTCLLTLAEAPWKVIQEDSKKLSDESDALKTKSDELAAHAKKCVTGFSAKQEECLQLQLEINYALNQSAAPDLDTRSTKRKAEVSPESAAPASSNPTRTKRSRAFYSTPHSMFPRSAAQAAELLIASACQAGPK
jgi:hypothetical protein